MSTAQLHTSHMAAINRNLSTPVYELGPLPAELPDGAAHTVATQLDEAGFTTGFGTQFTALGGELFAPLAEYDEAYWGMIVLHNQREAMQFEIDDQFLDMLRSSFPLVPRLYFLIARTGSVVTTAVRNSETIDIAQTVSTGSLAATASQTLLRLADPDTIWPVYQTPSISIPFDSIANAPSRRPDSTDAAASLSYRTATSAFTAQLRQNGMDPRAVAALAEILQLDHVAVTRVLYSSGPQRFTPEHASTFDYFHDRGLTVSYPKLVGEVYWKSIKSGTLANATAALEQLTVLPGEARKPIQTATASNATPEAILARLREQHDAAATPPR